MIKKITVLSLICCTLTAEAAPLAQFINHEQDKSFLSEIWSRLTVSPNDAKMAILKPEAKSKLILASEDNLQKMYQYFELSKTCNSLEQKAHHELVTRSKTTELSNKIIQVELKMRSVFSDRDMNDIVAHASIKNASLDTTMRKSGSTSNVIDTLKHKVAVSPINAAKHCGAFTEGSIVLANNMLKQYY